MKKIHLFSIALLTASAVLLSCEKDDPTGPVNNDETVPPCTFCPTTMMELNGSGMVSEPFAAQVAFHHRASITAPAAVNRTANGYYGFNEGMAIQFDFAGLPLACISNKISFSHARFATNSNEDPSLVNVQFPGTPLIVTVPDSLQYYLGPYGYTVEHYFQPGFVYMNTAGDGFAGVVDSVIITGPEFETVTIGANLFESELRHICIAHE